jgi:nucleotide-binding universal stress UspA family protein
MRYLEGCTRSDIGRRVPARSAAHRCDREREHDHQTENILWPTDFSPQSLTAADYVKEYCSTFGAKLHVIHVCQPILNPALGVPVGGGVDVGVSQAELLGAANAQLKRLCEEVFARGGDVSFEALVGNPWQETCAYAQRNRVDLIIVATHGRSGLQHVLMGSVAERIVQHAACPVLVVKSFERNLAR